MIKAIIMSASGLDDHEIHLKPLFYFYEFKYLNI